MKRSRDTEQGDPIALFDTLPNPELRAPVSWVANGSIAGAEDVATAPGLALGADRLRELAEALATDDLAALGGATAQELLGVVADLGRIIAQAQQLQAQAACRLARNSEISAGRDPREAGDLAAAEIAMATGSSLRQGREMVLRGRATDSWLPEVGEEARAGRLDAPRVRVFAEELDEAPPHAACAVIEQTLPKARFVGVVALRRLVRRVLAMVDPEGQAERVEAALARRAVRPVRQEAPGLGLFSALLPAAAAVALENACEAGAKAARAAGDERTLDQLRADVLTALGQQACATGVVGVAGLTDEVFRFDPVKARVRVTATTSAQRGFPWVDPATGLTGGEAHEFACSGELDPSDATLDTGQLRTPRPGAEVPEVAGFGPIAPREAAALVHRRWVAVSPPPTLETGVPPDTPGYRPSAALLRYVRVRDHECQAPGCLVPAQRCDAHHVIPWPQGPTSAENLRVLCRLHHRLITHEGHEIDVTLDGAVQWRTPLGQVWLAIPDGRVLDQDAYLRWRPDPGPVGDSAIADDAESALPEYGPDFDEPWWLEPTESENEYWLSDPQAA